MNCSQHTISKKIQKEGSGPSGYPNLYHVPYRNDAAKGYQNFIEQLRIDLAADIAFRKAKLEQQNLLFYSKFFPRADKNFRTKKIESNVRICLNSYDQSIEARRLRLKELFMKDRQEYTVEFALHEQAVKDDRIQGYRDRLQLLQEKRRAEEETRLQELNRKKLGHMLPEMVQHRLMEVNKVVKYQIMENYNKKLLERENDNMWHNLKLKFADTQAKRDEYDIEKRSHLASECRAGTERQIQLINKTREDHKKELEAEQIYIEQLCEQLKNLDKEDKKLKLEKKLACQTEMDTNNLTQMKAKLELLKKQKIVDDTFDMLVIQQCKKGDEKEQMRRRKELETVEHNKHLVALKSKLADQIAKDDEVIACADKQQREAVERKRCEFRKWQQKLHQEAREGIVQQIRENHSKRQEMAWKKGQIQVTEVEDVEARNVAINKKKNMLYQKELLDQIAMNQILKDRRNAEENEEIAMIWKGQIKTETINLQPWTHPHAFARVMQQPINHSCK